MDMLSISLFSRLSVCYDHQEIFPTEINKRQELFSYLLVYRHRPHHREQLANLFWGGATSTAQSKKYLRQALWQLSTDLEHCDTKLLLMDADWVQVNPAAGYWLDVADFEAIHRGSQNVRGEALDGNRATALKHAVHLYRGHLLEVSYHDWCLHERERLFRMYMMMLYKLMLYCRRDGDYESGIFYGSEMLRHEPAQENTHRLLMQLYFLTGDRTTALRQYETCVEMLRREFDMDVSSRTRAIYEQIKNGRLTDDVEPVAPAHYMVNKLSQLEDKLDRLEVHLDQFMQLLSSETTRRH